MQIEVKIKNIQTIHTDTDGRLDQPMIDVTLECNELGEVDKYEIKFSEQLSSFDGMNDAQILEHFQMLVDSYVKNAYKGQGQLDVGQNWNKQSQYLDMELTVDV